MNDIKLGVNIDHVATLRQARGTRYPDPTNAALIAIASGADSITAHLREDRRHIQQEDVKKLKNRLPDTARLNLEMAITEEMLGFAETIQPQNACFVPEKRKELTTEGGLDVAGNIDKVKAACQRLANKNIEVSLFIEAEKKQIEAAKACGAPLIELHTGEYAKQFLEGASTAKELQRLEQAAIYAHQLGLIVNAGHGLTQASVSAIAKLPYINELNIGHSIITDAVFDGIAEAVKKMKRAMTQ